MTNDQKEQLRQAALEVLVACHPIPRPFHAIHRNVERELTFPFTHDDLLSAIQFLGDLSLLEFTVDDLGSTKWYRATPAGCLKIERSSSG